MYNGTGSEWKPRRSSHSKTASNPSLSTTGSSGHSNSNGAYSSSNTLQPSSSLSRHAGTYTRRYEASSGRKSPVISGQSSSTRNSSSRSRSDSSEGGMHPAARALNKRATSAERVFPSRSLQPQVSKAGERSGHSATRSSYNRSLSSDRYGGQPDYRRLSSSVDYSSQLSSMGVGRDHLENGEGMDRSFHTDHHNTSREVSNSNSNLYQNGTSTTSRDRVYSADEVDKIRGQYNQEIQEIKLDYQSRILAKDREWDKKLLASKSELSNSQKLVMELRQRCNEMAAEYDKSMTELLNDKEQTTLIAHGGDPAANSEMVVTLRAERDQYADDLHQVEKSFTELHKRYDKLREALQNHRKNEERLKEELNETKQQLRNSSQNFEKLRAESQEKLSRAATEVEKAKASCKAEIMRLQMALKKSEVHAQSIDHQLKQKITENTELAQICDNLIALKGGNTEEEGE